MARTTVKTADNENTEKEATPVPVVESPDVDTAAQIAQGDRTAQFKMAVINLRKILSDRGEGPIEAMASGYNVEKRKDEGWGDRLESIVEAQFKLSGQSTYEAAIGPTAFGGATLTTKPMPQLFERGIKLSKTGDKLRTSLAGGSFAN